MKKGAQRDARSTHTNTHTGRGRAAERSNGSGSTHGSSAEAITVTTQAGPPSSADCPVSAARGRLRRRGALLDTLAARREDATASTADGTAAIAEALVQQLAR